LKDYKGIQTGKGLFTPCFILSLSISFPFDDSPVLDCPNSRMGPRVVNELPMATFFDFHVPVAYWDVELWEDLVEIALIHFL